MPTTARRQQSPERGWKRTRRLEIEVREVGFRRITMKDHFFFKMFIALQRTLLSLGSKFSRSISAFILRPSEIDGLSASSPNYSNCCSQKLRNSPAFSWVCLNATLSILNSRKFEKLSKMFYFHHSDRAKFIRDARQLTLACWWLLNLAALSDLLFLFIYVAFQPAFAGAALATNVNIRQ